MQVQFPIRYYHKTARTAFTRYLADLGFKLKKDRFGVLLAENGVCRVVFDPRHIVVLVQRISNDPREKSPAYDLGLLLESAGEDPNIQLPPANMPDAVIMGVDEMVRLLVEKCGPVLNGDADAWQRVGELAVEKEKEIYQQLSEAGLRLKEGDNWRELPELESVRVKKANKLLNTLVTFLLMLVPFIFTIFMFAAAVAFLVSPSDDVEIGIILILLALGIPTILLQIWIIKRFLLCPYYWETNTQGLTLGGYFKKETIRWDEVESVEMLPGIGYELRAPQNSIRVTRDALKNACLEASVWQHLNRAGKVKSLPLSPFAASLWAQIPDEKTEEIHWENPKPPHAFDLLLRAVLWEVLIWGIAIRYKLDLCSAIPVIAVMPIIWAVFTAIIVKRVSITQDKIEAATGLGKYKIPWKSVRSVTFIDRWATQPASLRLRAGLLGFIRIPWYPEHPNSTRVMLAIIKRLQHEERFKFLPFPAILLMVASGMNENNNQHHMP